MLRTALKLADKGVCVFPCLPRQKVPATPHGCLDATTDGEVIRAWWRERPDSNVAIATGAVSNVFVVDVDGLDAECALRRLEAQHSALPATVEAITPRPGRHIYFRMPDMPVRNSAGAVAVGIDIRGTGGFVIVPPSVHPSGKRYEWSVDSHNVLADAPDWLLSKIAEHANGNGQATPPSEWRALVAAGIDEGARDCTIAKLSGHLLRRFLDPFVVLDLMRCWNAARCRPPLPEADVTRIVESICAKELRRRGHAG